MQIADPTQTTLCNEMQLLFAELPLDAAHVLELGCGRADKTRQLAASGRPAQILALEVDTIQHARNLEIADLPTVRFAHAGAEAIPAADASIDIVLMFKSLHHVPVGVMDQALAEIARVLKPGGLAWISEPVFAGNLNEVFRLFHDEELVREAAFAAVCQAVESGSLKLEKQLFFNTRSAFDNFAQFDTRMIQVTHSDHRLSPELYRQVQAKFESFAGPDGYTFHNPQRVDLLRKPA
ncbi:class I SAM-dependent methyltransferase [Quatrionicoccus australiensis]|uniref:class I SAM-dependent methyltransferase n=1 Tax=Quatrionicoccus australiensis TaxID=138118 RepID=UPI001CF8EE64|nr:class I SAM-dependent methyltransferase [Quatrionicoccus australiensis]UCV13638.1 methyltransferase domain-containing protein [Quatrionicoccus australiensis]